MSKPSEATRADEASSRRRLLPTRLKTRVTLFSLFVLLVPCVTIPFFTFQYLRTYMVQTMVETGASQAEQHVRVLESRMENASMELLFVGQFPEIRKFLNTPRNGDRERVRRVAERALQGYLHMYRDVYEGMLLLDETGQVEINVRANGAAWELDTNDLSDQPFYTGAMNLAAIRGQKGPVHLYHPAPDSPLVYSILLTNDDGIISGVLVLKTKLEPLFDVLREGGPGELCRVFDAHGNVLLQNSAMNVNAEEICQDLGPEQIERLLREPLGVFLLGGAYPRKVMVFARARPAGQSALQWTALYSVPLDGLELAIRNAMFMVGAITLPALFFALFLAIWLSKRLTGPVTRLVTAANDLSHGYWETILPEPVYQDEIGELTVAFSSMTRQLRTAHQDLLKKVEDLGASEKKVAQEKERLAVILRSIADAVIALDMEGRVERMNPVAEDLLGLTLEEVVGKPYQDILPLHNQTEGVPVHDLVEKAVREEHVFFETHDFALYPGEGAAKELEVRARPIRNPQSEATGVVVVLRDVTELRRVIRETNRLDKLQSLGVLAGGIAHDFNNLITVVMGDLSLLEANQGDPVESVRLVKNALQAVERARALTTQLLTFSKGGAPVKKTARIDELVRDTAEFVLHGSNCDLKVEQEKTLWTADVDVEQIHQVFHNLFLNAIQSMPDGGRVTTTLENVTLSEGEVPPLGPGKYVRVRVRDQGSGISAEDLQNVFDPYFTTKSTGHGLGLSTVHSIVRGHGGHISVRSSAKGTVFTVHLPANTSGKMDEEAADSGPTSPAEKSRILVMDDDPMIRLTATRLLQHLGHTVTAVENGTATLQAFEKARSSGEPFDLVILDLTIPGHKGGVEVCRELRELDAEIPILVSSGYSQDAVMSNPAQHGFSGVIRKPYTVRELDVCLRRVL